MWAAMWRWINCWAVVRRKGARLAAWAQRWFPAVPAMRWCRKSAMCGVEILFAVSAATTLAVEVAERCNLTLVGFCKPGRATIYTHPQRLLSS